MWRGCGGVTGYAAGYAVWMWPCECKCGLGVAAILSMRPVCSVDVAV